MPSLVVTDGILSAPRALMTQSVASLNPIRRAFGIAALLVSTSALSTAPSPLALSCTGCHQSSVNSPEMPSLSALPASSVEASLKAFRDTPKSGSIMARFTAKMSDADIAQLAAELGAKSEAKKP